MLCFLTFAAAEQASGVPRPPVSTHLSLSARSASVGTWVDYTVTGAPASAARGQRVRVLVRAQDHWEPIGTMQFDSRGTARGQVTGLAPGVGRYVARVLTSSGATASQSSIVTITWTPAELPVLIRSSPGAPRQRR